VRTDADHDVSHLTDPGLIHVNTAISVRAAAGLPTVDAPWVPHVHELEVGLSLHTTAEDWRRLDRPGAHWVAASDAVAANLADHHAVPPSEIVVHHEMVDSLVPAPETSEIELRSRLGIPIGAPVVGTASVINWRKGPDLLLQLAGMLEEVHFVWVGGGDDEPSRRFRAEVSAAGLADRVHVVPVVAAPSDWVRWFDVFVLPAREDAFPLACLEAAAASRPIVCFDSGGMPEFVDADAGVVVPYPDVAGFAAAVSALLEDPGRRAAMGAAGRARVVAHHDVTVAAPKLHADLRRWCR
jgi:glycosyltransferase involved in cell wall biosynthesis